MSIQLGEKHFRRLTEYLNDLKARGQIPPDATAVATACGFDRGVLYKNPRCRQLWEKRIQPVEPGAPQNPVSRKANEQARRIRDLEQKNADLAERLARSEAELERLKPFALAYEHASETGRDIIP